MRIRVHAKSGAKIRIITEIRTIIEELFYLFDIFLLFIFYFMQKKYREHTDCRFINIENTD